MRHASPASLDRLEGMLHRRRATAALTESQRGIFYSKGKAFLHFHEDPAGLFADLRAFGAWQRWPVNTAAERDRLLAAVNRAIP